VLVILFIYDKKSQTVVGVLMFKMFFQHEPGRGADDLVQSLSLLFLTPVSSISADVVWATDISRKRKIESLSINELLTYTVCKIKGVQSMTVVDFKKPFNSDDKFIDSFKENYLGTVKIKITKAELVKLARLQSKLEYNGYISNWLNLHFPNLKNKFEDAGLNDQECKELEKLYKLSSKPVDDWIESKRDEIKNDIKPLTKFIVRGF
jgi:hypothetical protein